MGARLRHAKAHVQRFKPDRLCDGPTGNSPIAASLSAQALHVAWPGGSAEAPQARIRKGEARETVTVPCAGRAFCFSRRVSMRSGFIAVLGIDQFWMLHDIQHGLNNVQVSDFLISNLIIDNIVSVVVIVRNHD